MTFRKITSLVTFPLLLAAGGCQGGWSTTPKTLQSARDLSASLAIYRNEQADRVQRAKEDYQNTSEQLLSDFTELTKRNVELARNSDAQTIADSIISDLKTTLIGSLRASFNSTVQNESSAIQKADAAVAQARNSYNASYTEAKLSLATIDKVQTDLRILSEPESLLSDVSTLGQWVIEAHQELQKQADSNKTGTSTPGKKLQPASKLTTKAG